MRSIGELREERMRLNLSQSSVARAMHTTQSALSRAERDGNPTQSFLSRYEDALKALGPGESVLEVAMLRLLVGDVVKRHHVAELYVYGSVARGEAHADSDVDLLYRLEHGSAYTMADVAYLREDLESALGRTVSLTSYDSLIRDARRSRAGRRFLDHITPDLVRVA
ncbi:nucleotidyltransferase domain-containing protein [Bifidobacterium samirii]|uniref:Nucleotidyltransferase n=1 Tax=Bifidobacterium samirii TaxID=2306974 RepID=A0A430FUC9_9BIFI|nr:nucleotidyltransferase domain-containing protein [Bifidobacterium samirii]RSX56694.1 nucleotidyltransferase [Bifidobacterium samirii]